MRNYKLSQNTFRRKGHFMNYTEDVVVRLPGLARSYNFLHISDAHIAYARDCDSDAEKEFAAKQTERWNLHAVAPIDAFTSFLSDAETLSPKPDAVFMTGDCTDYYSESNAFFMRKMLPKQSIEYLYVPGNHEGGSYTSHIPDIRACYPLYAAVMQNDPAFWVRDFGAFLVVGVDDSDRNITDEQLCKMQRVTEDGRPILLLLHIPLCTPANREQIMQVWGPSFMLGTEDSTKNAQRFSELIKAENSHVAAIFAGHLHFAHTGEFAPGRIQYVSAPLFNGFIRHITVTSDMAGTED